MGDRARTSFQAFDGRGIFGGGRLEVAFALAQVEVVSVTTGFGNATPQFEHQVAVPHTQVVTETFERDAGTGNDLFGGQVSRSVKFDRLAVFLIRAEGGFGRTAVALRLILFAAVCRWSVEGAFLFHQVFVVEAQVLAESTERDFALFGDGGQVAVGVAEQFDGTGIFNHAFGAYPA